MTTPTSQLPPRQPISGEALDQIFLEARTHRHWLPVPVPLELLHRVYELARMGPTSGNCCPARFVFVVSAEAKARLKPFLAAGNVDKTMTAPATAIVAYDLEFYEKFPKLSPRDTTSRDYFKGDPAAALDTAFRNGSLQGAYLMMAARALGLDCGPMSGFDQEKLDAEFFPEGKWKSNFLCNLGYGDASKLYPRAPRLDFDEAAQVL